MEKGKIKNAITFKTSLSISITYRLVYLNNDY